MREREKRDQRSSEISFRDGASFNDGKRKNESGRDRRDRDRDRDRSDRDRDRDRSERDRSERIARCGDWSEHVSSSGEFITLLIETIYIKFFDFRQNVLLQLQNGSIPMGKTKGMDWKRKVDYLNWIFFI